MLYSSEGGGGALYSSEGRGCVLSSVLYAAQEGLTSVVSRKGLGLYRGGVGSTPVPSSH